MAERPPGDNPPIGMPKSNRKTIAATIAAPQAMTAGGDAREVHLVVMAGNPVGQVFKLSQAITVIGRDDTAHIKLVDPGISRHHAMVYFDNEKQALMVRDMDSRNGTSLNGQPVTKPCPVSRGDKIGVGMQTVLRVSFGDEVETHFAQQMYDAALRDALTGAFNRRFLEGCLETEIGNASLHGAPLSLVIFDIDHFKKVNDTYGHPIGDEVLRWLCQQVRTVLTPQHVFARYGGEEFVVLCRDADEAMATQTAEAIRQAIVRQPFRSASAFAGGGTQVTQEHKPVSLNRPPPENQSNIRPAGLGQQFLEFSVTSSFGVAQLGAAASTPAALLEAADQALYSAKQGGRNRVISRGQLSE
jgi:two-component system cell cycle response regulator